MIAIEMTFPAGRWHATPWGRQVNEGAVEWPPSPWRLLRALLAVWYTKCPEIPEEDMRKLISALSSPPSFYLPPASQGHTRHYMPVANDNRTKIFDTFATVAPEAPLIIAWPDVELEPSSRNLLDRLLRMMTYFGRAESWVEAKLLDKWDETPNAILADGHAADPNRHERVRVLTPEAEGHFAQWREDMLQDEINRKLDEKRQKARDKGKDETKETVKPKELATIEASLPETIFDALHATTGDLRKAGWNRPPGSRWIDYLRPADAFTAEAVQSRVKGHSKRPTVARFAVAGNVLPRLTEALWIGERVRLAVMSRSKRVAERSPGNEEANAAPVFSGKRPDCDDKEDVSYSLNGHTHAHFLCESAAGERSGKISHITVFAPRGYDHRDRLALSRLCKIWGHGGHDLQLAFVGLGQPEDFGGTDESSGQSRLLDRTTTWVSRTPFVPTDHLRIRPREAKNPQGREGAVRRELERIVRKEIKRRPWLADHIELLDRVEVVLDADMAGTDLGGHFTRWLKFRRTRQLGNGRRGGSRGYGFRLTFKEPVRGPIILGYGCHFGLGQFWSQPRQA